MKPRVLVVGSFALDSQSTPFGSVKNAVGGSGVYAALASRFFAPTALVGSVGTDFPKPFLQELEKEGLDLSGLQYSSKPSFKWFAEYGFNADVRTDRVELNALVDLRARLPENLKKLRFVFLANENPAKQKQFLELFPKRPLFVAADTIGAWIKDAPREVLEIVRLSDLFMLNESEARALFQTPQLYAAAQQILKMDSQFALIKKGEDGAVLYSKNGFFAVPGYPLETALDPTGCGDSFAGALTGFIAKEGKVTEKVLRKGMVFASAIASFNAEKFSCDRLLEISMTDIKQRVKAFKEIVRF